jgi:hypothetical protein
VNWYNGALDMDINYNEDLDLENVNDVAIIGNGNVAIDITRILSKDPEILRPYDIPTPVYE